MAESHMDVRYEATDVRIGPVVAFLTVLVIILALIMGLLWATQAWVIEEEQACNVSEHPLATARAQQAEAQRRPPQPQIEGVGLNEATHSVTNPNLPTSARSQRLREEEYLKNGWTDALGRKHPPIADAIRQLIEREGKKVK